MSNPSNRGQCNLLSETWAACHDVSRRCGRARLSSRVCCGWPPLAVRRPDEATTNRVAAWLESELDRAASARPSPGRPMLRRLNRAEYANAVRDLLSLDIPVASLLPPDDAAFGFDNISDVLNV